MVQTNRALEAKVNSVKFVLTATFKFAAPYMVSIMREQKKKVLPSNKDFDPTKKRIKRKRKVCQPCLYTHIILSKKIKMQKLQLQPNLL